MGKWMTRCSTKSQPYVLLGLKENLPPGWYTQGYGGGGWTFFQGWQWPLLGREEDVWPPLWLEGVGPPLTYVVVGYRYIDIEEEGVGPPLRVGLDQLWASLGPLLTYMFMPGVQNVTSMGAKVWREENFFTRQRPWFTYSCTDIFPKLHLFYLTYLIPLIPTCQISCISLHLVFHSYLAGGCEVDQDGRQW